MKFEIDTTQKLTEWLDNPVPAVFQGQDLRNYSQEITQRPLINCSFLGCIMDHILAGAAARANCLIMPCPPGLPFDPFTPRLYSPDELYNAFEVSDPVSSYHLCKDWIIYNSCIDPDTKRARHVDLDMVLLRRLHDASIADALHDLLDTRTQLRSVAIMGGHDRGRDEPIYASIAHVALELQLNGYMIITGGGPGLMESGNLGAYCAGFRNPEKKLGDALEHLKKASRYNHKDWLAVGYETWKHVLGVPDDTVRSRNIGIPTWFYGHEPPNVFATHIAKYFENSLREEGMLAVALAGVLFAEGNAGTVQEIFQDACQNYYRTYENIQSPMILFGTAYWNAPAMNYHDKNDKQKQLYPLLHKLATEKSFDHLLLLTDNPTEILPFIKSHAPI